MGDEVRAANVLGARDTAAMVAAGWTMCLDEFDGLVAGESVTGSSEREGKSVWRPEYESYVAEGMPSGAR